MVGDKSCVDFLILWLF